MIDIRHNGVRNNRADLFTYLSNTGGVKFSTSAVLDGMVHKDYVVIHSAPGRVTRELIGMCVTVSISEGLGLLIPTFNGHPNEAWNAEKGPYPREGVRAFGCDAFTPDV